YCHAKGRSEQDRLLWRNGTRPILVVHVAAIIPFKSALSVCCAFEPCPQPGTPQPLRNRRNLVSRPFAHQINPALHILCNPARDRSTTADFVSSMSDWPISCAA